MLDSPGSQAFAVIVLFGIFIVAFWIVVREAAHVLPKVFAGKHITLSDILPSFAILVGAAAIAAGLTPIDGLTAITATSWGVMIRLTLVTGSLIFVLVYLPGIWDERKLKDK